MQNALPLQQGWNLLPAAGRYDQHQQRFPPVYQIILEISRKAIQAHDFARRGNYTISWRNNWMLKQSDYVVTYISHFYGGAVQYAEKAKRQKKIV